MAVFKRFRGKKIYKGSPDYAKGTWVIEKRIRGERVHVALPDVTSKKDAEAIEAKIIADKMARRRGMASNVLFAEFVDGDYLKYVHQHNADTYGKEIFVNVLKTFFGKKRLADITAQDCRDFQFIRQNTPTRYGTKRAAASVNKETSTLSKIFVLACEQGLLQHSPMQWVKKLKEAPPRKRMLTEEQKQRLWIELEKDVLLSRLATLAVNLPLRRGQLLAITPDAVDLAGGLLCAIASKKRESRIVPLNNTASDILRRMIKDNQLPLPVKRFEKRWQKALIAAGINKEKASREDNFHFHDLRSVFGTELLKRGANPYHIKDLFAHSDMVTSAIYVSSEFEQLRQTVQLLDIPEVGGVS